MKKMNLNCIEMTIDEWLGKDNEIGQDIWNKKYRHNNETFEQWLSRVSGGNMQLKQLIREKKFLFAGRILSNRGVDIKGLTYSNCYVMTPPEDNIESIFETAGKLARTFSYGGGCGIDISKLAPKGAKVNNSAKVTSGAISFMDLYSMVTGLIGQNGRRGALMLSMDVNHPDIEEFITIKNDLDKVTKANISIKITDHFMHAVENRAPFDLEFVREDTGEKIEKRVDAYELFKKICESNWDYAEPGMLYWDGIKKWNLLSNNEEFEFAGVNPCAEEPLPSGGSCLLGSINLAEFVTKDGHIDEEELKDAVRIVTVALNEVLDEGLLKHPLQEQRDSVAKWRQMGLGIFGLADLFIKMGVRYGSLESIDMSRYIARTICDEAIKTSSDLATIIGPYKGYNGKVHETSFLKHNVSRATRDKVMKHGLANSQLLSIAPTGSISTMLGVSGGIEPIYDTHYVRKTESLHGEDKYYTVYTPIVKKYMDEHNINDIKDIPDFITTAKELDYKDRIEMQAIWQKSIDASISSTLNVPYETTVEEVMDIYKLAWERGLKGITIFRDKCKRTGILTSVEEPKEDTTDKLAITSEDSKVEIDASGIKIAGKPVFPIENIVADRITAGKPVAYTSMTHTPDGLKFTVSEVKPVEVQLDTVKPITRKELGDVLQGTSYVKNTACGKMYITINRTTDNKLVEVFIDPGKSGGCSANAEALGRYASACMRAGMSIESLVDITKGVKCSACTKVRALDARELKGFSCSDILARTIEEEYNKYKKLDGKETSQIIMDEFEFGADVNTTPDINTKTKLTISDISNISTSQYNEENNIVTGSITARKLKMVCPECGNEITNQGGCTICLNCGHSKCD